MRRIVFGFTAFGVAVSLVLSGCGRGGSDTNAVSIKTLQTAAATSQEQSMRFTVDQHVDFGGKPFTIHADGVSSADGRQARVTLSSPLIGDVEGRVVDGVVYLKFGDGLLGKLVPSGKPWIRFDPGSSGFGGLGPTQTSPKTGLDLLKALSGNVETIGDDTVAGRHAVHYRASIDPPSGEPGSLPVDVWIDDQDRVVKVETTIAPGSVASPSFGGVSMTLEVTDFDVPVDVTPPPDDQVSDFGGFGGLGGVGDGGLI